MGWPVQQAGDGLEELIECAVTKGPQEILDEGKRVAIVLSAELYDRLRREVPTGGDETTVTGDNL